MDVDEREIFQFLKTYGAEYVSAREICRRASGRKRYHEDNDWAKPTLQRMVERHILETNAEGQYRVKPTKKKKQGKWIAPDIAKILEESGVKVGTEGTGDIGTDDYYEQL
jgi:hypothetical protein